MSLERQIPDHILSPRLAHRTTDSAVGQPLIGATWVGKYPRVCQWHARTRRWADTWRQGTPWARPPPLPHLHIHTHMHTPPHAPSFAPHTLSLPSRNNTVFLILECVVTICVWGAGLFTSHECACVDVWGCAFTHMYFTISISWF